MKKVDKISDIVSGNPMVIKMIVGFYKSGSGQVALREILGPLVKQVLDNKDLHINTNPVEIYKQWINGKELETGNFFLQVITFFSQLLFRPKGQLISKCPYEKSVSSKIPTKIFLDFCPEIFCSFLGASW